MPRDLVLEVLTKAEGKGLRDTADGLDRTATSSDEMGKSFHEASREGGLLEGELGKVHQSGDKTTQTFKEATQQSGLLQKEIQRVSAEIKRLGAEFDATGNTALLKDIGSNRSMLNRLTKVVKDLAPEAEKAAQDVGGGVAAGVAEGFNAVPLKPALIGALAIVAAGLAPGIGATLGGVITAAVGTAGIAGAIVSASHDPMVKSAWKEFTASASADFFGASGTFVAPLIHAIGDLKAAEKGLNLGEVFDAAAPLVDKLATAVGGFGTEVMPGLTKAMREAGPVFDVLAEELPKVGKAFGDMFADIDAGKGNAEGLAFAFDLVDGTLITVGKTVRTLSDAFHDMNILDLTDSVPRAIGQSIATQILGDMQGEVKQASVHVHGLGDDLREAGRSAAAGAHGFAQFISGTKALSQAIDDAVSKKTSFEDTLIAWHRGLDQIGRLAKENGRSLSLNTTVGQDNLETITRQVALAEELRQKTFEHTGNIKEANTEYNSMIKKLKEALIQEGFNKKEVDRIVNSLSSIPATLLVDLNVRAHVSGFLGEGAAAVAGIAEWISGQLPTKTKNPPKHRASGGDVMAGVPYVVNEPGFETVTFPAGGTVHPAHLTPAGGARTAPIVVTDSWLALAFQAIRAEVARQGGDVQAVFGPRR